MVLHPRSVSGRSTPYCKGMKRLTGDGGQTVNLREVWGEDATPDITWCNGNLTSCYRCLSQMKINGSGSVSPAEAIWTLWSAWINCENLCRFLELRGEGSKDLLGSMFHSRHCLYLRREKIKHFLFDPYLSLCEQEILV